MMWSWLSWKSVHRIYIPLHSTHSIHTTLLTNSMAKSNNSTALSKPICSCYCRKENVAVPTSNSKFFYNKLLFFFEIKAFTWVSISPVFRQSSDRTWCLKIIMTLISCLHNDVHVVNIHLHVFTTPFVHKKFHRYLPLGLILFG